MRCEREGLLMNPVVDCGLQNCGYDGIQSECHCGSPSRSGCDDGFETSGELGRSPQSPFRSPSLHFPPTPAEGPVRLRGRKRAPRARPGAAGPLRPSREIAARTPPHASDRRRRRRRASGHDDNGLASRQAGAPAGGAIAIARPVAWVTFPSPEALRPSGGERS